VGLVEFASFVVLYRYCACCCVVPFCCWLMCVSFLLACSSLLVSRCVATFLPPASFFATKAEKKGKSRKGWTDVGDKPHSNHKLVSHPNVYCPQVYIGSDSLFADADFETLLFQLSIEANLKWSDPIILSWKEMMIEGKKKIYLNQLPEFIETSEFMGTKMDPIKKGIIAFAAKNQQRLVS